MRRGRNPFLEREMPNADQPVRVVAGSFARATEPPAADEVRVWVVRLDAPPAAADELLTNLTADERERAARYRAEAARRQFITARGLLRRLLGECLGVAPAEVPITYTGAGKPVLAAASGLHFNVTHTDNLALLALARRPVGIDAERLRAVADPEGLVGRFFSAAE